MMNTNPIKALKSLSELALAGPLTEPLAVYEAVAVLAGRLAGRSAADGVDGMDGADAEIAALAARAVLAALAERAARTTEAIGAAERCALEFRELLGGGR